jgi:FdhE protein
VPGLPLVYSAGARPPRLGARFVLFSTGSSREGIGSMSGTATVRVMPAEEIAARAGGKTEPLRWPDRATAFAERAMRLRQLANGHAMGDFLKFASRLAQAQQTALTQLGRDGGVPIPDAAAIDRASMAGVPPVSAADWSRGAVWHQVLRDIVAAMRTDTPPGAAADALARLVNPQVADEVFLERQADALLNGVMAGVDLATAPVIAAALQVMWTHMAIEIARAHAERGAPNTLPVGKLDEAGLCPCCGSRPVVSITRASDGMAGQRYLHCSLCGTEWYLPRVQCAHCGAIGAEKVAYESLDYRDASADPPSDAQADEEESRARAAKAAIQAETCDACGHYLKIVHGDRDPLAEPVADDLASITLDLLVADSGKQRYGVNLLLLFGDGDGGSEGGGHSPGRGSPEAPSSAPPGAG